MISKVVSGGQTGADRAALDVALQLGFSCGGWVPKGRMAEDGCIPETYVGLVEAPDEDPNTRTALNVRDSDATLILSHGEPDGGSKLTATIAKRINKPSLHIDLSRLTISEAISCVSRWLAETRPVTLNVAGPRSSEDPLIYFKTRRILEAVLMDNKPASGDITLNEELLSIALARRDAALANFRHWDQVRWLVPYWYCVLATGIGALTAYLASPANEVLLRLVAGGLGAFGLLCLKLVWNLGHYHNLVLQGYEDFLDGLPFDAQVKTALRTDLPFALTGNAIWSSATCWFFVFIAVLTILFAVTALFGMWW